MYKCVNDKNVFVNHSVNDIDDINVFIDQSENELDDVNNSTNKPLENELVNDKNVLVNHSVNDIDDIDNIDDINVFINQSENELDDVNDFVNTKVNNSRNDNREYTTKKTKLRTTLIENKSVVLSGGYLYPFCSTFFTFFTLFSIFNFERQKNTSALVACFFFSNLIL